MSLKILSIHNSRNIKKLSLDFHPTYNILYGSNGAGKTAILESIYLLLRARTFRSNKLRNFINIESDECVIYSQFVKADGIQDFTLGIKRSKADKSSPVVHLNTKKIYSLSSISKLVVLGLIIPDSFNLLDSAPFNRRKYLDWGVFHVEHVFLRTWKDYKRVLMNRNCLLKKYSNQVKNIEFINNEIKVWDKQLVILNDNIDKYRKSQFNKILPIIYEILTFFSKQLAADITFTYYQGWKKDLHYKDLLMMKFKDDLLSGFTCFGTHRSDIKIVFKGKPAKDVLSRGQKKILIIVLILAQFVYLIRNKRDAITNYHHFILLLDDLDSELDDKNLKLFTDFLLQFTEIQYFITTTNPDRFKFIDGSQSKMFHVEHFEFLSSTIPP
jgi:DNA replication and repair protein RecF